MMSGRLKKSDLRTGVNLSKEFGNRESGDSIHNRRSIRFQVALLARAHELSGVPLELRLQML